MANFHIVMVPYMGVGHVMPMLVLARKLADLGLKITFVIPGKQLSLRALGSRKDSTPGIKHEVVEIEEYDELITCHGLREQTLSVEEYLELYEPLFPAMSLIRHKIDELIAQDHVDALVLDPFHFYRGIIVDGIENVKMFAFSPMSATSIFCFRHLMLKGFTPPSVSVPELSFQLFEHDFPPSIVPGSGHPRTEMHADRNKWMDAKCTGLIVNTWEDIEGGSIEALVHTFPPHIQVYSVGPLFSSGNEYFAGASDDSTKHQELTNFLNSQAASSVLFVCMGSWLRITDDQMEELAMGLEASKVPFLWILRDGARFAWLDGLAERTKGRGFVQQGWAPQQFILGHEAVGGFLMTSGWNSVIEGLMLSPNGVAFVAWPLYLDHMPTCRLLVDDLGVAVEVKTANTSNPYYGAVKRGDVSTAARSAMLGKHAEEMRARARSLGVAARSADSDGQLQMLVNRI